MTDAVIEAVLRRDRAIVAAALFVLAGLAWAYMLWLAVQMGMGGMDMSGFRMVPDRWRGSDDAGGHALERGRGHNHLCNVGSDDGRHDDAVSHPHDPYLYTRSAPA